MLPARGHTIALRDDGLVTGTDGRSERWHRSLPAAAGWLTAHGAAGVLRPLPRGMLAVVTPHRITAYRTADGDLCWVLPAREGCAARPEPARRADLRTGRLDRSAGRRRRPGAHRPAPGPGITACAAPLD
ncbi:hypothetical protein ABZ922_23510 [Streptomyces shenzhenensis]|uniref:hypothetical protein n=1 Tax=Streptomyces shenzhenensis TaxID=943815 RepID=UPI0033F802FB